MSFISAVESGIDATGGDNVFEITQNSVDYRVHEFTSVGTSTLDINGSGEIEFLIIGGGGGGGGHEQAVSKVGGDGGSGIVLIRYEI